MPFTEFGYIEEYEHGECSGCGATLVNTPICPCQWDCECGPDCSGCEDEEDDRDIGEENYQGGRYIVTYQDGHYHSRARLQSILIKAGDIMTIVEGGR